MKNEKDKMCISCKKCTQKCIFLTKYELDFSQVDTLNSLAYHCMLCGECTRVCPIQIDGRARLLEMRTTKVQENDGNLSGYTLLRLEKNNYKFKNYRNGKKKSILFAGCNYPSFFPKTLDKIMSLVQAQGMGVVFDCCGKPIGELGLQKESEQIISQLNYRLKENGIEEMVVLCPNCFDYLAGKVAVPIVSIYEKLAEFGMGAKINGKGGGLHLFLPCPDRKNREFLKTILPFLPEGICEIQEIQCCGLGGIAASREPQFAKELAQKMNDYKEKKSCNEIYVYCASCAGSFTRHHISGVHHVLSDILQTQEQADVRHSLYNRIRCTWK